MVKVISFIIEVALTEKIIIKGVIPFVNRTCNVIKMKNRVKIKLCIGILGVCIISLDGDETDGVFNHISLVGEESWFNALPPHDHPIDGTYEILCDVFFSDNDTVYKIVKTKSSHDRLVELEHALTQV